MKYFCWTVLILSFDFFQFIYCIILFPVIFFIKNFIKNYFLLLLSLIYWNKRILNHENIETFYEISKEKQSRKKISDNCPILNVN